MNDLNAALHQKLVDTAAHALIALRAKQGRPSLTELQLDQLLAALWSSVETMVTASPNATGGELLEGAMVIAISAAVLIAPVRPPAAELN